MKSQTKHQLIWEEKIFTKGDRMSDIKCMKCKKVLNIQMTRNYGFVCKDCDSGRHEIGHSSLMFRICSLCGDERYTLHVREYKYPKIKKFEHKNNR